MAFKLTRIVTAVLSLLLALGSSSSFAGDVPIVQGAPTDDKDFKTLMKQAVPLEHEIPGMENRQLRIRLLTIEPGGHIKVHSHKNRPAAFYVIQGATTIIYGDGTVKRFTAGSMGVANKDTVHWHKNNEKVPVVLVAADIFQAQ